MFFLFAFVLVQLMLSKIVLMVFFNYVIDLRGGTAAVGQFVIELSVCLFLVRTL